MLRPQFFNKKTQASWKNEETKSAYLSYTSKFSFKAKNCLKMKWGINITKNKNRKQIGVIILISFKIDFKVKPIRKVKGEHFILSRDQVLRGENPLNIYVPSSGAPNFIKKHNNEIKKHRSTQTNSSRWFHYHHFLFTRNRSPEPKLSEKPQN